MVIKCEISGLGVGGGITPFRSGGTHGTRRCVTIPVAYYPCLSCSKYHGECMEKVGLDLIKLHAVLTAHTDGLH